MSISERQDAPAGDAPDSGPAGPLHRLTGAVPVCAALIVLAVLVTLLSSSVRHRLSESFQRQPERYVELYFADPAQASSCHTDAGRLIVRAIVRSHLADARTLPYAVTISTDGHRVTGTTSSVAVLPGETAGLDATLTVPTGDYDVAVSLTGRTERLALHCTSGG